MVTGSPWESTVPKLTVESGSQGDHSESRWTAWVLRELSVESRLLTQKSGKECGKLVRLSPFEMGVHRACVNRFQTPCSFPGAETLAEIHSRS